MAGEAFAEAGMGDEATGEGTSFESVFESVKTSLPGLGESKTDEMPTKNGPPACALVETMRRATIALSKQVARGQV